ncbi:MAG: hypothetical protein MJZ89_04550 [Paludibacteraceae bacterium]|nr:hypothetical protein [Paludibacteraceae bacterium]
MKTKHDIRGRAKSMTEKLTVILAIVMSVLTGITGCTSPSPLPQDLAPLRITECAPMPAPRMAAMAFSDDSCGYVFGGRKKPRSKFMNDFWKYSAQQDKWIELPVPPLEARSKGVAVRIGNYAYIGLGYAGFSHMDDQEMKHDFWRYDIASGEWKRLADYPSHACTTALCWACGETIYVACGYFSQASGESYAYDIDKDAWRRIADCPVVALCPTAVNDGERWFVGMGDQLGGSQMAEFFPETETWSEATTVSKKMRVFTLGIRSGKEMWIIGGRTVGGTLTTGYVHDEISIWLPDHNQLVTRGRLPNGMEQLIGFTIGNQTYVGLGNDMNEEPMDKMWRIER